MHAHLADEPAALLKALFYADTDAAERRSRLIDYILEPEERLALCQKIVDYKYTVVRADEFLFDADRIFLTLGI